MKVELVPILTPWRDVITPHPDVQVGRYQQAEFAADLAQVLAGTAGSEYGDAQDFFRRTYLTVGMKSLLAASLARLHSRGEAPVVQLKTAFGGGKTHTMLALYHLVREPERSAAVDVVRRFLEDYAAAPIPAATAVLVGSALDPNRPARTLPDVDVEIHTLWGEMAYQLGATRPDRGVVSERAAGFRAFQIVAAQDAAGTAPGSNTLVELFTEIGPCVILIDELVAFMRNIRGARRVRSGDFNSNLTFVHNLTEAVKRVPTALLVASIPESRIELGDSAGEEVARKIENTFGRLETVWQPVASGESFEVVRRRLFGVVGDEGARDETVAAFARFYRENPTDFPAECREKSYEDKLRASYPIHPEIFDRLYEDWSVLERFQRTRGVLRLMANTIHALWERGDAAPLIMPGSLPLDSARVRDEMTRYLGDQWNAVVDGDVDGPGAASGTIDAEIPRMGQISAARRVAHTIFLGSVPNKGTRGVEDVRVKLGVAQPGESIAVYVDALGRMRETLTHLYSSDQGRYWFAVQPNLNRTVADRAAKIDDARMYDELERRMKLWGRDRGTFAGVHIAPPDSSEVPDEDRARLVVLAPRAAHRGGEKAGAGLREAATMLDERGTAPRRYKNMLLFLAADADMLDALRGETARYLAWKSVVDDAAALNLDNVQERQAAEAVKGADAAVSNGLASAYAWLLVPAQEGTQPIEWDALRLTGGDLDAEPPVVRAARRAQRDELLIDNWSPALLKMELDRYLWPDDAAHVGLRQVWTTLATYVYLPRLRDRDVLARTVKTGAASIDFFGYAVAVDGDGYQGLSFGRLPATVYDDDRSVIVKPDAARQALDKINATVSAANGRDGATNTAPLAGRAGATSGDGSMSKSLCVKVRQRAPGA